MNFDSLNASVIIKAYNKKKYNLCITGDYNLNIFGIRLNENISNKFNDVIGLLYKVKDNWILKKFKATTDPGLYYREHPCNIDGTAILVPNQYKGCFTLGYHQGKYEALVQNKPVRVYRDNNKDKYLDRKGHIDEGMFGINIHHASSSGTSENVDKWSAGCQVISSISDWNIFLDIVKNSSKIYGKVFTYTLFTESDF